MGTHHRNIRSARRIMAATVALLLCGRGASAQRTMNNQLFATITYTQGFSGHGDSGVEISCGRYRVYSLWNAGVSASLLSCGIGEAGRMRYAHAVAYGEWLWRLWCTRDRRFSLYAGGGPFAGCELYDPFGKLPDHIDTGLGKGAFLYGVQARTQAELFLTRKVALTISGCLPVNMTSPITRIQANIQAGLRINL